MTNLKRSLTERRILDPIPKEELNPQNVFVLPLNQDAKEQVLKWVDENTDGDFYLSTQILYFVEDHDRTAFLMFDMDKKYKRIGQWA